MSMIPFYPSLRPSLANRLWYDRAPMKEESEIMRIEQEHHLRLESIKNAGSDIHPLGRVLNMVGMDTDDEDANDDSDDTDTHEDDDEDTNDRALPVVPARSTVSLYSPGTELNLADDDSSSPAPAGTTSN